MNKFSTAARNIIKTNRNKNMLSGKTNVHNISSSNHFNLHQKDLLGVNTFDDLSISSKLSSKNNPNKLNNYPTMQISKAREVSIN